MFAAVEALEDQVSDLEDQLAQAEASIGHVQLPNGDQVPLYRKVIAGTKDATETIELPHGLAGVAAAHLIEATYAITARERHDAVRYVADRLVPLT